MRGFWRKVVESLGGLSFFAEKNERDFSFLAITAGVAVAPFSLYQAMQGRLLMALAIALLSAWFLAHGVAVWLARRLLPAAAVFLPALGVLALAFYTRADLAVFWGFPAILLFHFILPRWVANLYNATILVMSVPFTWVQSGPEVATRVGMTMFLTIVFANVFSWVTERQRRREEAEEQRTEIERDRLALLVHATRAGFSDWDAAGDPAAKAVIYSERFKELLGYPADADTSAWPYFFELMHPEDRPRVEEVFRAMLREKRQPGLQPPGQALDYRLRCADGSYVWVHAESLAQVDQTLRIRRFITSYQDITKFREQDARLLEEQRRFELVVRASNTGILDWDGAKRTVYYSDRLKEILGWPADTDTADMPDYWDLLHPEDRERVETRFRQHIIERRDERLHENIEYRLRCKDGSYVWIEAFGASVKDEKGYAKRFIASITDVSERRAQEERLVTERRRLDLVVRAQQVGIVDWDGRTHATYYSPRFKEILGHPPEADTSNWPDYFKVLIHPDDRERVTKRWRGFLFGTGPEGPRGEYYSPEDYRLLRADGSYVWVQVSGVAVRDEKGFVVRWIASTTDITERRKQEETLRESVRLREEVERMSRHDLKTPLNSVIAMSRLLRENAKLAPEDAELLGTVERAGYRILNMVNLSLDLFRMESDTYELHPRAIDLAAVARRVAADLESQAVSKEVDIQIKTNDPVVVRGDDLLCYSMFANLIKNAIEAAPEGGAVAVTIDKQEDWVVAKVHNPGAVPDAVRDRFFQKYATAGKSAGLGLGAYSARLMARVQEGEITLQSSEAAGTSLMIRLKAAQGNELPAPSGDAARAEAFEVARKALPPQRVLVVDDDEFNRLVLRRTLPTPPLTLAMAVNGRAALEAAARDWPDVVLLDLEMPVMDGYETARRLRELEKQGGRKRCKIVAISSNDERSIVERALAAGCDDYLVKPAPREALWQLLAGSSIKNSLEKEQAALPSDPVVVDADLKDTLAAFLESRRKALDEMPAALTKGDRPRFKRLAHRLAGSFALYGFAWASAQCRALESHSTGAPVAELLARVQAVRSHLGEAKVRFEKRPSPQAAV